MFYVHSPTSTGLVLVDLSLLWFLSQASTSWQGWFVPSQILNSTSSACLNLAGWKASPSFFFSSFFSDFFYSVAASPFLASPSSFFASAVFSSDFFSSAFSSDFLASPLASAFCSPSPAFSVLGFSFSAFASSAPFFFASPVSVSSLRLS